MGKRILVALGGNAIKQADKKGTSEEQFKNCMITCKLLAEILRKMGKHDRLVITHGNGPQAGKPSGPTRGSQTHCSHSDNGYCWGNDARTNWLHVTTDVNKLPKGCGINTPVCAVVNQVLVDKNDPEFFGETASKPVGNFFTEEEAMKIKGEHPEYIIKKVIPMGDRAWRRTVPPPDSIANVESVTIRKLVNAGSLL